MQRQHFLDAIYQHFEINRIVGLLGPRQCGKTTIAEQFCKELSNFSAANYFDLENLADLQRLESPQTTLIPLKGFIIIDEIQRRPDLFPTLRYLSDKYLDKQFLILGSASRELIQQSSESLAGRISYIEVTPFSAGEMPEAIEKLWFTGGYPKSFLAKKPASSFLWLQNYLRTYTEQDLPTLGIAVPPNNIMRFWFMLSHYHGQIFNASEIGGSLGFSSKTIAHYLHLLSATFMVRVLRPWHENLQKRQIKSPKIYIRDSGIFHYLQNLKTLDALLKSPKLGASWEGFALEAVLNHLQVNPHDAYFWATHNRAELDLMITQGPRKVGFEFKYGDAPKLTPSMKIAMDDLGLEKLMVIYPGSVNYPLAENVSVIGLKDFCSAPCDRYV